MKKTTYVIMTGMHRTGTSMLSGALGLCGLDIGTNFRAVSHPCNPKGYFEDLDFKRINRKLMAKAGIGPGSFVFPDRRWRILAGPKSEKRIIEFIARWDKHHAVGWKDPRACLTLHVWRKYIDNLKVVTISRPTIEIAHSLKTRRSDWTLEFGHQVTELYLEHLERHCKNVDRIDVKYHDFFHDRKMRQLIMRGICDFIGITPSKGWRDEIELFIDKKLWRERQSLK